MNTKVEEALAAARDFATGDGCFNDADENEMPLLMVTQTQQSYLAMLDQFASHIAQQDATIARLTAALQEARDLVESWAAYAEPYFQEKHGLADDLAELDAALRGEVK